MAKNMNTYFLQFKVVPTTDNEQYELAERASAHCWVQENNPQTAATKAAFQISKFDWEITGIETPPTEVKEEHFAERDLGLEQFKKAQVDGMAIVYFEAYKASTAFGFKNLERHKLLYDRSLKSRSFSDIKYVLFLSNEKPTIAFSGLLYPDFDFMGRQLQNLGNHHEQLQLITFCSAPMTNGWGYLFSWHNTSSSVCTEYMQSLATMMHEGHTVSDFLFRMVILNCENCAISPEWWELLSENQQKEITAAGSSNMHPFSPVKSTYLSEGLEGVSGWQFDSVISNMD